MRDKLFLRLVMAEVRVPWCLYLPLRSLLTEYLSSPELSLLSLLSP